jgi:hypothetical protein
MGMPVIVVGMTWHKRFGIKREKERGLRVNGMGSFPFLYEEIISHSLL